MSIPIIPCKTHQEAERMMHQCLTAAYSVNPTRDGAALASRQETELHRRAKVYREIAESLRRAGK